MNTFCKLSISEYPKYLKHDRVHFILTHFDLFDSSIASSYIQALSITTAVNTIFMSPP